MIGQKRHSAQPAQVAQAAQKEIQFHLNPVCQMIGTQSLILNRSSSILISHLLIFSPSLLLLLRVPRIYKSPLLFTQNQSLIAKVGHISICCPGND